MMDRRLILSHKNIGKGIRKEILNIFSKWGLNSINKSSFIDIENNILYLKEENYTLIDEYTTIDKIEFKNYLEKLSFPLEGLVLLKQVEYCGLLEVKKEVIINFWYNILKDEYFGGYFTLFNESNNSKIEFDFDINDGYSFKVFQILNNNN